MKTIKQQLLMAGMVEEDFSNHYSDLYVRVTPISKSFVAAYEFKNLVTMFIDNIEHVPFYEIPFAYCKED